MKEVEAEYFSLQSPLLYATSALVLTAAALVFGYLYTHKSTKDVSKEKEEDAKMTDAQSQKQTTQTSEKSEQQTDEKEKDPSVFSGNWPTDEERCEVKEFGEHEDEEEGDHSQKLFEIPADAPENIKRMLEMGFPGCPMFRRTPQTQALTSNALSYPGRIPLAHILGSPHTNMHANSTKADFAKKPETLNKSEPSKKESTEKDVTTKKSEISKKKEMEKSKESQKKNKCKKDDVAKDIEAEENKGDKMEAGKSTHASSKSENVKNQTKIKTSDQPSSSSQENAKIGKGDEGSKTERDPVEFCSHLQSEVKRTQQKVAIQQIEEEMTAEQKENERDIQRKQLESIFKLMAEQEDKFGIDSMDDIQSQMKLYM